MKNKLHRLVSLFVISVFTMSVWAQSWTPSELGNGTYYLYNVGAKAFLCSGNNWGSHASVTAHGGIPIELQGEGVVYNLSTNAIYQGKFVTSEGFMDGGAFGWTFESSSDGTYKIKNGSNVLFWNGGTSTNMTVGADPGTDASLWKLVTEEVRVADFCNATAENPIDATFLIRNAYFAKGNGGWVAKDVNLTNSPSWKGTPLTHLWGNDQNNETACYAAEQYQKTFDNYQELKGIPNGLYHLTAKGFYRGTVAPYIYAGNEKCSLKVKGDIGSDGISNAAKALLNDDYLLDGVDVLVEDGELRVGVKSDENIDWCVFDDFRLTCLETNVSFVAAPYSGSGMVEANKWYVYNVASDGKYSFSSTVDYTAEDGLQSEVSMTEVAGEVELTAGDIYIKSTIAQELSITPANLSYNVGTGTSSIDGAYVQDVSEVVIAFADAATNDANAVLTLLDAEAVASLKKGGEEVATSALVVDGTNLKASFTDVALENGVVYTLDIPANVFGYEGKAANEAVNVTFNTPAVFDGTYYLKTGDRYFSRAENGGDNDKGTRVVANEFGIATTITTDKANKTVIQFYDSKQYFFCSANSGKLYGNSNLDEEHPNFNWEFAVAEGGYTLRNIDKAMNTILQGDDVVLSSEPSVIWTLDSPEEHAAAMLALKDAQASAAATAAGFTASTVAELEANLASVLPLVEDVAVKSPSETAERYQGMGKLNEQTVTVGKGLYKLEVRAFSRMKGNAETYIAHKEGVDYPISYIYANDVKTQLASVMDSYETTKYDNDYQPNAGEDIYYPNSQKAALKAFGDDGRYVNTLYIYIAENETELNIGINIPTNIEKANWLCYGSFKLTRYAAVASEEQILALNDAIADAEKYVLGFAEGEYAPYTNVKAAKTLAAAKAIDPAYAAKDDVVALLAALENAVWTVNAEEMNAIYDGSFEYPYSTSGNVQPIAWHGIDSRDNATDIRYMWDATGNAGLNATSTGKALFTKFNAFYGTEAGYTMPLKANTKYELTFIYGGWSDCKKDGYVTMDGPAGEPIELSATDLPLDATNGHQDKGQWKAFTATFQTNEAGDYVLGLRKKDETKQSQYVYGDFRLFAIPAAVTSVTLDKEEAGLEIGATLQLTATIEPADAADKTLTWTSDNEEVAKVDANGLVTALAEGQAVITVTTANGFTAQCVVTVSDPTGIEGVDAAVEAVIYDIHGRRVSTMQKGIYILNGKKVIK